MGQIHLCQTLKLLAMVLAVFLFQLKSLSTRSCAAFILSSWHPVSDSSLISRVVGGRLWWRRGGCRVWAGKWQKWHSEDCGFEPVKTNTNHMVIMTCCICVLSCQWLESFVHSYNLVFVRHVYLEPRADRFVGFYCYLMQKSLWFGRRSSEPSPTRVAC